MNNENNLILKTKDFIIRAAYMPHISRKDGGHIVIFPNKKISDRTKLFPRKAIELMKLTMIVGEAYALAMNKQGVKIGRINYQDNGNWGVFDKGGASMHIHIYGRAKNAKIQKWGEALKFPLRKIGFKKRLEPLTQDDINQIKKEISIIIKQKKYQDKNWKL